MKTKFDYKNIIGENNPILKFPKVFESALDEYSANSYDDASLNEIIKKSGISKGSMYHHFEDKFGLYLCMIDIILKRKMEFFSRELAKVDRDSDFFYVFKYIIKAAVDFLLVDERYHHMFNRIISADKDFLVKVMSHFNVDYDMWFGTFIKNAMDNGIFDKRYSHTFIVTVIKVTLGNLHEFINRDEPPSVDEVVEMVNMIIDFMQYGLVDNTEK